LFGKFEIDVTVEQNVNFVVKMPGADVFIAKVGVRDVALIERIADPADGVGVGPGNPDAEARHFRRVMRNVGERGDTLEIEGDFFGNGMDGIGAPGLIGDEP
jgi:hypothetical protein